jgi:hypothetical protein
MRHLYERVGRPGFQGSHAYPLQSLLPPDMLAEVDGCQDGVPHVSGCAASGVESGDGVRPEQKVVDGVVG